MGRDDDSTTISLKKGVKDELQIFKIKRKFSNYNIAILYLLQKVQGEEKRESFNSDNVIDSNPPG